MASLIKNRRGARLLPVSMVLLVGGLAVHYVFVPAPAGARATQQSDAAGLPQIPPAGATAAAAMAAMAAIEPASAGTDSPLAHGTIGDLDITVVQGIFEKMVFGGLLVSTIAAWWRGTVGGAQTSQEGKPPAFWGLTWSCASLVLLLSARWYESGHFPLSNMYESLMFLAWGVTAVTIYFAAMEQPRVSVGKERAETSLSDLAAVWASPLALAIVAFATLTLPKELQKASALVPALQSNWLVMHVSVVMLSYATLLFGSVLCMGVLALSQPKDSPLTQLREAVSPAFRSIADGLGPAPRPVPATSPPMQPAVANMSEDLEENKATPAGTPVVQMVTSGGGAVSVEFSQAGSVAATLSEEDQLGITLDDLAYRSILLGFGFLTIGIISGAVWANEAWGNYWSWDPKETWALICWLVYAGYLHTRLQLGWDTRDSAKVGAFGFFIVWLCYIGVNLMGVGLHSYGFFLK